MNIYLKFLIKKNRAFNYFCWPKDTMKNLFVL